MRRRDVLAAISVMATSGSPLCTPHIARATTAQPLRLVPHADLANFDPIWNPAYIARNAGMLAWDTLYGVDPALQPQRQMVEAEEVSAEGKVWTFRLRPGLMFHDGEPVLARDAVASIRRWSARDPMGQMIRAVEAELVAMDDLTFRWTLRRPFPKMKLALGKIATPCCFIMPERIARTDSARQIDDYVGSGPMRFRREEWVPGARAVFERFDRYVPRPEPAAWMAGGKRIAVPRTEWVTIPDAATASAALLNGEVDWWERVVQDLAPMLARNGNVVVRPQDEYGFVGLLLFNHVQPPFNDVLARWALLMALNQADYMRAIVGDDQRLWQTMPGFFPRRARLFTDAGGEILTGPRSIDAARKALAESGYRGEPIVLMAAQDIAYYKAFGDLTADMLRQLGAKVDYISVDWGTVVARRAKQAPPNRGGWNLYITGISAMDCIDPGSKWLSAKGDLFVNGWANSPAVQADIAAWYDATDETTEAATAKQLNEHALRDAIYAPLGNYSVSSAWRKSVLGIQPAPMPFLWEVRV